MGNGEQTPIGCIFGAIAAALLIISLITTIFADISIFKMFS